MSLGDLADRAGVGKSTVHELESGRANPSIETLWAIANALGVPFGRLVEDRPGVRVVRCDEGVRVGSSRDGFMARLLASSTRRGTFEISEVRIPPEEPHEGRPHHPGTEEYVLCVAGRLRTGPDDDPVELGPGDLASFPGDVPHHYVALTPGTHAVLVMSYG